MSYKLKILPSNEVIVVGEDYKLMTALKEAGHYIKSSCGGSATCSDCIIKIVEGENNLSEITFEEKTLLGNIFHLTKERLSCQTKIFGDVTVDISNHDKKNLDSELEKKTRKILLKKKGEAKKIEEEKPKEFIKKLGGGKRPKSFKYSEDD